MQIYSQLWRTAEYYLFDLFPSSSMGIVSTLSRAASRRSSPTRAEIWRVSGWTCDSAFDRAAFEGVEALILAMALLRPAASVVVLKGDAREGACGLRSRR
jgi:hypothetical protein